MVDHLSGLVNGKVVHFALCFNCSQVTFIQRTVVVPGRWSWHKTGPALWCISDVGGT